jgi:PepSY-associated TM region
MKRWLFLAHRWLGLGACLMVLLWFASGFVMMYVPFPALTEAERLAALPDIDMRQLMPPPQVDADTERLRLLQPFDEPVYATLDAGGWQAVSARSARRLRVDAEVARAAAQRFAGVASMSAELIERDQWTVPGNLDAHRPLWAVSMADGGRHYVSSRTGEVVRDTAQAERAWNWVGAVVHWVYPTALRSQPRAWHWVVLGLSGYALLTAVLGTVVGLWRWRRYASGRRTPYRGWMRWHHLLGLWGAVFILGWLLSGLLSMNPGDVFSPRRVPPEMLAAWRGEPLRPGGAPTGAAREIEWLADRPGSLMAARGAAGELRLLRNGQPVGIDETYMRQRAVALGLGEPIAVQRLDAPDLYLNARAASGVLPVWRICFADAHETWLHVDGRTGQPIARLDRSARAQRWLYNGLHSWDFEPLLQLRPLWDVLMLAALALGTALSITSVVIAWRRLFPARRRGFVTRQSPPLQRILS